MRGPVTILPLCLEGVSYGADGETFLGPVSLTFELAQAVAIIGPNGAGKSLFLRLCHGLITPSQGAVRWTLDKGEIAGRKRHAMVFQKPAMLRRSAIANLVHACRASGLCLTESHERAVAGLQRFGLGALAERPARLLSGGEQQRLAIARAAALAPDVLFLDEPSAHLDPGATRQVEDMLLALKGQGMTLVFATHDLAQARRLAERVVFLYRGKVAEDTSVLNFFAAPQSEAGKAFITGDLLW